MNVKHEENKREKSRLLEKNLELIDELNEKESDDKGVSQMFQEEIYRLKRDNVRLSKEIKLNLDEYKQNYEDDVQSEYKLIKNPETFDETFSKRIKASDEARELWNTLCHQLSGCRVDSDSIILDAENKQIAMIHLRGALDTLQHSEVRQILQSELDQSPLLLKGDFPKSEFELEPEPEEY